MQKQADIPGAYIKTTAHKKTYHGLMQSKEINTFYDTVILSSFNILYTLVSYKTDYLLSKT